jgi:hypothetical protein
MDNISINLQLKQTQCPGQSSVQRIESQVKDQANKQCERYNYDGGVTILELKNMQG